MVKTINVKVGNGKNVYLFGDFHAGSKNFDKASLVKTVNIIKKDKNAVAIIMGDLIEAILPQDKRFDIENIDTDNLTAERQYNTIKKILEPIKGKVIGVLSGNHDYTLKSITSFDVPHLISHDLNATYFGSAGIVNFDNGKTMFVTHGFGTSTSLASQIQQIFKLANSFKHKPDIIAMGHVHALQLLNNAHLKNNFDVGVDYFAFTGSYYKTYVTGEDNYGTRRVYSPLPIGCIVFNLNKQGDINGRTIIFK